MGSVTSHGLAWLVAVVALVTVVVRWPVTAPHDPANDPLGALAPRRVTDTNATEQPVR